MTIRYSVTSKDNPRQQYLNVTMNDMEQFQIDFSQWQDDNDTITGVSWLVEAGQATLGTPTFLNGVTDIVISFPQAGRSMISATAVTATRTKKIWLNINSHDELMSIYDDGYYSLGFGP